jgi:hypothetical protein
MLIYHVVQRGYQPMIPTSRNSHQLPSLYISCFRKHNQLYNGCNGVHHFSYLAEGQCKDYNKPSRGMVKVKVKAVMKAYQALKWIICNMTQVRIFRFLTIHVSTCTSTYERSVNREQHSTSNYKNSHSTIVCHLKEVLSFSTVSYLYVCTIITLLYYFI